MSSRSCVARFFSPSTSYFIITYILIIICSIRVRSVVTRFQNRRSDACQIAWSGFETRATVPNEPSTVPQHPVAHLRLIKS
ncbi:hypothetical protein BGY98DRAFT_982740 [Russula aff. rugulosa BPL654]|nr:hypothetical protein BGY98DRAFT_982740 [Russula aff. rugulosa BPL654]